MDQLFRFHHRRASVAEKHLDQPRRLAIVARVRRSFRERDCGLTLLPGDPKGGAKQLAEAISNPTWLAQAGRNARHAADYPFDRDNLAVEFESVLQEAVAER